MLKAGKSGFYFHNRLFTLYDLTNKLQRYKLSLKSLSEKRLLTINNAYFYLNSLRFKVIVNMRSAELVFVDRSSWVLPFFFRFSIFSSSLWLRERTIIKIGLYSVLLIVCSHYSGQLADDSSELPKNTDVFRLIPLPFLVAFSQKFSGRADVLHDICVPQTVNSSMSVCSFYNNIFTWLWACAFLWREHAFVPHAMATIATTMEYE